MSTRQETGAIPRSGTGNSHASFTWKWVLYAIVGIGIVLALKYFHVQDLLKSALDWIGNLGPWGPVIFVGLYVVATVLFVPGSVLTLGAGAVFGVALGSVCVSISATLGATAAFLFLPRPSSALRALLSMRRRQAVSGCERQVQRAWISRPSWSECANSARTSARTIRRRAWAWANWPRSSIRTRRRPRLSVNAAMPTTEPG